MKETSLSTGSHYGSLTTLNKMIHFAHFYLIPMNSQKSTKRLRCVRSRKCNGNDTQQLNTLSKPNNK